MPPPEVSSTCDASANTSSLTPPALLVILAKGPPLDVTATACAHTNVHIHMYTLSLSLSLSRARARALTTGLRQSSLFAVSSATRDSAPRTPRGHWSAAFGECVQGENLVVLHACPPLPPPPQRPSAPQTPFIHPRDELDERQPLRP